MGSYSDRNKSTNFYVHLLVISHTKPRPVLQSLSLLARDQFLICTVSTSRVGIATGNRTDRPGNETSRTKPRPIQPTVKELTGSFPGVKRQEIYDVHPTPSSAGLQSDWNYTSPTLIPLSRQAMGCLLTSTISIINNVPSIAFIISKTQSHIL